MDGLKAAQRHDTALHRPVHSGFFAPDMIEYRQRTGDPKPGKNQEENRMSISPNLLQKYAELIVRTGANVQPGQVVQLVISVEQHAFAAMVIEACYKAGAKKVNVDWTSDVQSRLNFLYAEQETLATVLPWEEAKMKQMTKDLPCRIYIASEDPDAMNGIDP